MVDPRPRSALVIAHCHIARPLFHDHFDDLWIRWVHDVRSLGRYYLQRSNCQLHSNGLNILPAYTNYFALELNTATLALNTASVWIGGCIASFTFNKLTDIIGRRAALFHAAVITLIAVILQTAAQNVAMFVVARILIGFGTSASGLCGPAYLAETLPLKWRAWGLGLFNDFYYVGTLLSLLSCA